MPKPPFTGVGRDTDFKAAVQKAIYDWEDRWVGEARDIPTNHKLEMKQYIIYAPDGSPEIVFEIEVTG